jgi:hypothetical protein
VGSSPTRPTTCEYVSIRSCTAEPWLPTTAEQDAAFDEVYGEGNRTRANAAEFTRGFSAA